MIKILLLGLIVILSVSRTSGQNTILIPVEEIKKNSSKNNNITDTIIQEIEIKHISQTIIEYKISAHHYDSLGYSFGFDVIGKAYSDSSIFPILSKEIDKYSKEYLFYNSGSDCYLGIGINRKYLNTAIIIIDNCLKEFLVNERKMKLSKK